MATQTRRAHGLDARGAPSTASDPAPPGQAAGGGKLERAKVLAKEFFARLSRERTLGLAAEMAFWLFLSLIPIAVVCGMIAARLAMKNWDKVDPILQALPPAARELMTKELQNVAAWNGEAVAPISLLIFVWLASSGIHAIFDALELQTGASRPWWKKRLVAIAGCVVFSVGVAVLTLLGTGLEWIARLAGSYLPEAAKGLAAGILRVVMGALVSFCLVAFLYWAGLPSKEHRRRMPIVPGAIFVVIVNAALGYGYSVWIAKTGTGDAYTAGLAVIGVMLTGLYLFSVILLMGAEINQMLAEVRGDVRCNGAVPPKPTGAASEAADSRAC